MSAHSQLSGLCALYLCLTEGKSLCQLTVNCRVYALFTCVSLRAIRCVSSQSTVGSMLSLPVSH